MRATDLRDHSVSDIVQPLAVTAFSVTGVILWFYIYFLYWCIGSVRQFILIGLILHVDFMCGLAPESYQ